MRKQQPNAAIVSKGISAGNRSLTPMPPTSVEHSAPPFGRHRFGRVCKSRRGLRQPTPQLSAFSSLDEMCRPPNKAAALYWSVEPATCWLGRGSRRGDWGGRCIRAAFRFAEIIPLHALERSSSLRCFVFGTALKHRQRLQMSFLKRLPQEVLRYRWPHAGSSWLAFLVLNCQTSHPSRAVRH
jgi:hypothetical protein